MEKSGQVYRNITEKYKIPVRAIIDRKILLNKLFEPLTTVLQNSSNTELDWNTITNITRNIIDSKPYLQEAFEIIKKNPNASMAKTEALSLLAHKTILKNNFNRAKFRNDLFIIGRYFYNALENNRLNVFDFLIMDQNDLLKISSIFSLHPLLSGAIFESFFDIDGNFKNSFNNVLLQLSLELDKDRNSMGYEFIRECLKLHRFDLNSEIASIFNL